MNFYLSICKCRFHGAYLPYSGQYSWSRLASALALTHARCRLARPLHRPCHLCSGTLRSHLIYRFWTLLHKNRHLHARKFPFRVPYCSATGPCTWHHLTRLRRRNHGGHPVSRHPFHHRKWSPFECLIGLLLTVTASFESGWHCSHQVSQPRHSHHHARWKCLMPCLVSFNQVLCQTCYCYPPRREASCSPLRSEHQAHLWPHGSGWHTNFDWQKATLYLAPCALS